MTIIDCIPFFREHTSFKFCFSKSLVFFINELDIAQQASTREPLIALVIGDWLLEIFANCSILEMTGFCAVLPQYLFHQSQECFVFSRHLHSNNEASASGSSHRCKMPPFVCSYVTDVKPLLHSSYFSTHCNPQTSGRASPLRHTRIKTCHVHRGGSLRRE